jgi:hypothetical protein
VSLQARFEKPAALARCEIWKRDARRRGDRMLMTWMRILDSQWWLADTPEVFHADLSALLAELKATADEHPILIELVELSLAGVEVYRGLASEAFARMTPVLERARASPAWLVPRQRVSVGLGYVPAAIAHAEASRSPVPAAAEAVLAEFPVQTCGVIDVYRAAIANLAGDRGEAIRLLERAEAEPGKERTRMVGFGARYGRGRLIGGAEGRALILEQVDTLRGLGCANPERLVASYWPGFRSAS